jgi:predicted nucleic acid-binding protein
MTRYLLDTNVVSEVRKVKPRGAAVVWLRLISAVTLGELQAVSNSRGNRTP